jgi:hypothetical protein
MYTIAISAASDDAFCAFRRPLTARPLTSHQLPA